MTLSLDYIRKKLGWCPHAKTMYTSPPVISTPPVTIHPSQPDGGTRGSGRIDRGIKLALGSFRILFRNRQLLWFSLLTGIVMLVSVASSLYLQYLSGAVRFPGTNLIPGPASVVIAAGSLPWIAMIFVSELVYAFLTYYLLAALITCVSIIISGRVATMREGFANAGKHSKSLFMWAVVGALIGTLSASVSSPSTTTNGLPGNFGVIIIGLVMIAVFYLLTVFVIPLIVLGDENLVSTIGHSVSLFRRLWGEIIACFFVLFGIAFAVMFTSMIPMIAIGFSTATAGVILVSYMLVMIVLLFVGSTILGIAITGLYSYGKTGTLSSMFEGKQDGVGYV
ncbi:MAG: DUF6159 family protein [Methanoregulaceae archaeon]